ncbi:MAG: hypothetical protein ABJF50_04850 [Paracoccaceae bacterium]
MAEVARLKAHELRDLVDDSNLGEQASLMDGKSSFKLDKGRIVGGHSRT